MREWGRRGLRLEGKGCEREGVGGGSPAWLAAHLQYTLDPLPTGSFIACIVWPPPIVQHRGNIFHLLSHFGSKERGRTLLAADSGRDVVFWRALPLLQELPAEEKFRQAELER